MDAILKTPVTRARRAVSGERSRRDRQGRLLHGYMHKTSNSLCGIKGYASLIAKACVSDGHEGRWARKIIAEVEQLEAIYRSVQDMAFPDPAPGRGGDLATVLHRCAQRATARHPNLSCVPPRGLRADLLLPEHDLELVLDELLANCAEGDGARAPGPVGVRLIVRPDGTGGRRLVLGVADDGPGLPAALSAANAVDPFVSTKDGHLGIGLARVDTIAEMYGLAWSLTSIPARGTVVSLEVALLAGALPEDDGRET
jgi:signal transduction histidine kinase